ncbi:efflux RND transporter permease subunit [Deinococcus metallilatus]|uniref:Efflux RND transporter permease subunit n=1 Tax=Deinococcus metallilatus TaxID=1211322 RepID=A0AAJ5JY41_9DEIO|nr:efflux RND transporter permease subunit [Deinococcus metallilatus]MBB5296301.1 HAE1 family hydrophobic/amphiphilic exporter-1 [Deinococcus metallilatus]QBY10015.1 efflux RND transporter permease subunit [Deinococcus metallilatus]RXJ08739.1 efflux RND transporter permease subunit [Deinococcus metallilatus]TLK25213.1 efflux RND transporter permease subunit [Deinococcus metallilatus]GMA14787.1 multidrug transporter [Deinococcus metallilatus]
MSTHDPPEFSAPRGKLPDGTPEPAVHPAVRFSVRNYVFSIGIFVMAVLFGLIAATRLGVELLPNFEVPVLAVSTSYPGATPDQVDREVSRRIEDAVSTLGGVVDINTTSVSGQSAVVITFADKTNIDSAANSVSQAVAAIRATLPEGADAPVVQKFDPNATPILTLALLGGPAHAADVTTYAEDTLVPRLERVPGVADVSVSGGPERQIQVLLDPARLQTYNLAPGRVTAAIQASALDVPAGSLTQGGNTVAFSTRNTPTSLSDVERIVVDPASGLRVADVASVRDTTARATSYARVNGQPAVLLNVRKASGTNSVAVADAVRQAMEAQALPAGYQLTLASDTTRETRSTVHDTFREFLLAIAAVGVIVLLFLGRLNTVFAVILAIPISISAAPLLYSLLGFSFNIVSLLAIIVAIGIVVDDSIVVAENVQRYRDMGYSLLRSVLLGGSEVFSAVTAASFSLLAVLIPLSFMPGILGQFFSQFGLGLAAAIVMSWLESLLFLTVRMAYTRDPEPLGWGQVPGVLTRLPRFFREALAGVRTLPGLLLLALAGAAGWLALDRATALPTPAVAVLAVLLAPVLLTLVRYVLTVLLALLEALTGTLHGFTDRAVMGTARAYARSVGAALRRPWVVMLIAGLFLLSVPLAMRGVGFSFVPKSDSGILTVDVELPAGTDLARTNALTARVEADLLRRPEVSLVQTSVGAGGVLGGTNANTANLTVTLVDKAQRPGIETLTARYARDLSKIAGAVPGAEVRVATEQTGPGGRYDLSLALTAPNQARLTESNRAVLRLLAADPNIRTVESSLSATRQERTFVPDPSRLAGSGLSASDVAQALRTYNDGTVGGTLRDGDRSVDIVVRLDPAQVQGEQSLLSQTVYSPSLGANIPLAQLGNFQLRQAPATLSRLNKAYTATLNINLKGGVNPFAYQQTIIEKVRQAGLLTGNVTLGNASAFGSSGLTGDLVFYGPIVLVLAVLLTYLVLGSQFNSFRYPVYLLLPIPLAIVGALWTLHLFRVNLDVITVLGMVILLGLSTKNSILYLEFVTERMRSLPLRAALIEAAELRFRPILMTTLTVLVISLPLVFGQGSGAEFRRGLGIVILGGVITSTLLTFYVVPSVFYQFERRRQRPPQPEEAPTLAPAGD